MSSILDTSEKMFECKRCGYSTIRKIDLLRHLERKKICIPSINDIEPSVLIKELTQKNYNDHTYDCSKCGTKFNTRQSRHRHMKTCKSILKEEEPSVPLHVVNELKAEFEKLKQQVMQCSGSNTTVNNGTMNINNGVVNNINIQIRNFGQENMDALPMDVVRGCFMNLDFKEIFKNIYCDNNFPENHNIKIKSKKNKQLLMYKQDQWNILPFSTGFEELFHRLSKELVQFIRSCKDEAIEDCGEEEFDRLCRLLYAAAEKVEEAKVKKFRKEVDQDLLCVLEERNMAIT